MEIETLNSIANRIFGEVCCEITSGGGWREFWDARLTAVENEIRNIRKASNQTDDR